MAGKARKRRVVVVVEDHYVRTPEGVYARINHPYEYWQQLLELFDEVCPVARVAYADRPEPSWHRADGPGVRFLALDEFQGLRDIFLRLPKNWLRLGRLLREGDYFFVRGTGSIGYLAWIWLMLRRQPYARQFVGDDLEVFNAGMHSVPGFILWPIALFGDLLTSLQARNACSVAYVSPTLATRYPRRFNVPAYFYSDVRIKDEIVTAPRLKETFSARPLRLISCGRLSPEKGYQVLLDALAELDQGGVRDWTLTIVGPGPDLAALQAQAEARGVADRVEFAGFVRWGPDLFSRLDHADLYVQPSVSEGLPRAMVEAMVRGLPAIGTRVGGIPWLAGEHCVAPPQNPRALADLIAPYVGDVERLAAQSALSFEHGGRFRLARMRSVKLGFWRTMRTYTDRWRARRNADSLLPA